MENKILVLYIGVHGIRSEDIGDFTKKISKKIIPTSFVGEVIVIPTHSPDTRIECINPKYITDNELIDEHHKLINEINSELRYQLNLINEENQKLMERIENLKNKDEKEKSGN